MINPTLDYLFLMLLGMMIIFLFNMSNRLVKIEEHLNYTNNILDELSADFKQHIENHKQS